MTRRLDPDKLDSLIVLERMKNSHRVRSPTDTGNHCGWKPAGGGQHLRARLAADHRLKLPDHSRIRRGPNDRADDVVAVVDVRHPVANGFARRVLQRARA